jgi:hypothetical protein
MAADRYKTVFCAKCGTDTARLSRGECSECCHRYYLRVRDAKLAKHRARSRLPKAMQYDRERNSPKNPRWQARQTLRLAVYAGKIERPANCSRCGVDCIPHGHHEDYAMPLVVTWLCQACHSLRHRELRAQSQPSEPPR